MQTEWLLSDSAEQCPAPAMGIRLLSCMLHASKVCRASYAESLQVPVRSPPTPSWIHDFPVTQNYAVLPETPVVFNLKV